MLQLAVVVLGMVMIELPNQEHLKPSKRKVLVECSKCGNSRELRRDYYNSLIKNGSNTCLSCAVKEGCERGTIGSFDSRQKASQNKWKDSKFREKVSEKVREHNQTEEFRSSQSLKSKELWSDEVYAKKISDGVKESMTPEIRSTIGESIKKRYSEDSNYRDSLSRRMTQRWTNEEYRRSMAESRLNQPQISSLQIKLYKYLDDLGIQYHKEGRETLIGHYMFDCLVPKQDKMHKNLLIECQGDYWHLDNINNGGDKRKFTYIDRYFPEHEIMYLWEHEFSTKDRIINRLKSKIGIDSNIIDFDFKSIELKNCQYKELSSFLDAYHYIGKGRGGISVGAYLNDILIGAIVYSPKLRDNHDFGQPFRELSRLCIHPNYQKKNFASWLISKSYKFLDVNLIISYCDTTAGHDGAVYKASNFKLHHEVKPDYWYVDVDGYVMHKKTLYLKARSMKMTELQYAETYNFSKIYGGKKLCFIREIK